MSENEETKNNSLFTFFSNPVIGLIGAVASILSVLLAVYFYMGSRESRELIYYVHPAKIAIVKSGVASRLSVRYDNKDLRTVFDIPVAQTDVTATRIAFWNNGKLPIKKNNILKPFVIQIQRGLPILEVSLQKKSRDITGITIDENNLKNGIVSLNWDILEHNDWGIIQIIYAGGTNVEITANGIIEGQSDIRQIKFFKKIESPSEQYTSLNRKSKIIGYFLIIVGIITISSIFLLIILYKSILKKKRINANKSISSKFMIIVLIILYAYIIYLGIDLLLKTHMGVPFDF